MFRLLKIKRKISKVAVSLRLVSEGNLSDHSSVESSLHRQSKIIIKYLLFTENFKSVLYTCRGNSLSIIGVSSGFINCASSFLLFFPFAFAMRSSICFKLNRL